MRTSYLLATLSLTTSLVLLTLATPAYAAFEFNATKPAASPTPVTPAAPKAVPVTKIDDAAEVTASDFAKAPSVPVWTAKPAPDTAAIPLTPVVSSSDSLQMIDAPLLPDDTTPSDETAAPMPATAALPAPVPLMPKEKPAPLKPVAQKSSTVEQKIPAKAALVTPASAKPTSVKPVAASKPPALPATTGTRQVLARSSGMTETADTKVPASAATIPAPMQMTDEQPLARPPTPAQSNARDAALWDKPPADVAQTDPMLAGMTTERATLKPSAGLPAPKPLPAPVTLPTEPQADLAPPIGLKSNAPKTDAAAILPPPAPIDMDDVRRAGADR